MIRKIIKIGNSEGVTIPVSMIRAYKLNVGDRIEIFIDKPGSYHKGLITSAKKFERLEKKLNQIAKETGIQVPLE